MMFEATTSTSNPLFVAASAVGLLLSIPGLTLLVRGVLFIGKAVTLLETVSANQTALAEELKNYSYETNGYLAQIDVSFVLLENDVNVLQKKNDITVREFPERRKGVSDRRAPS